jgi:DNA repair exonuclease SbcCD ATPase subunit
MITEKLNVQKLIDIEKAKGNAEMPDYNAEFATPKKIKKTKKVKKVVEAKKSEVVVELNSGQQLDLFNQVPEVKEVPVPEVKEVPIDNSKARAVKILMDDEGNSFLEYIDGRQMVSRTKPISDEEIAELEDDVKTIETHVVEMTKELADDRKTANTLRYNVLKTNQNNILSLLNTKKTEFDNSVSHIASYHINTDTAIQKLSDIVHENGEQVTRNAEAANYNSKAFHKQITEFNNKLSVLTKITNENDHNISEVVADNTGAVGRQANAVNTMTNQIAGFSGDLEHYENRITDIFKNYGEVIEDQKRLISAQSKTAATNTNAVDKLTAVVQEQVEYIDALRNHINQEADLVVDLTGVISEQKATMHEMKLAINKSTAVATDVKVLMEEKKNSRWKFFS